MAGKNAFLQQTHLPKPSISRLFPALGPKSVAIYQKCNLFQVSTETFTVARGPRYNAYARLRELNLRMKTQSRKSESELYLTPLRKQGKFQGTPLSEKKKCPVLARSVPNLAAAARREKGRAVGTPVKTPASSKMRKSFATMEGLSRILKKI